jgi:hypothetical protein
LRVGGVIEFEANKTQPFTRRKPGLVLGCNTFGGVVGGFAWVFAVERVEHVSWAPERRSLPAAAVGDI